MACVLCNDAVLQKENGDWAILGDPTEGALLAVAGKGGFRKDQEEQQLPRVAEFPFSSERKRMSVVVQNASSKLGDSPFVMFTKGSPELVLERCTHIQQDNQAQPITDKQRQQTFECSILKKDPICNSHEKQGLPNGSNSF